MNFDFDNERPIYIQLVEKLRLAIISGEYASGSKIPSVRELSLTAKVNPNTMQKALTELESEGLIYTERTNGKFVTKDAKLIEKSKKILAKEKVLKYVEDMNSIGLTFEDAIKYLQELGGNK
jgi:DNA-binding transcriptional regulator YhcF (GntR family)